MPIDPKKTKNGIDLNELDVSALTLVDKKNLLDELSNRLKDTIHEAFEDGIKSASQDFDDMVGEVRGSGGGRPSNSGGGYNRPPKPAKPAKADDPAKEFAKLRKIEANTRKMLDSIRADQKKKNKETRANQLKGNVYSTPGLKIADNINSVADEHQNYSTKELSEAKERLNRIQEGINTQTVGKESKILTDATLELQKSLDREIKERTTVIGKLGDSFTKANINIASIITGFASNSPIVGLATKYIFDTIREHKEQNQKQKSDRLRVTDLMKALPRTDEPIMDDKNLKIDSDVLDKRLGASSDFDVNHSVLENLHGKGQIDTKQLQNLSVEQVPPEFQPYWEKAGQGQQAPPVAATPASGTKEPTKVLNNIPGLLDHLGNPVPDWQEYQKNTSAKQKKADEIHAWLDLLNDHGLDKERKEYEELLKTPQPEDWDDGISFEDGGTSSQALFGDFHAKPTALAAAEKRAERLKANAPSLPMYPTPEPTSNVVEMPQRPTLARAASPIEGPPEHNALAPERLTNEESDSIRNLLESINESEKFQDEKLTLMTSEKEGPVSKLERLNQEQVEELKKINKYLNLQIEQADAIADARERETVDQGMQDLSSDKSGLKSKAGKPGGFFGGIMEALMGGAAGGGITGAIKKMFGFGGKAGEVANGGIFRRLLGGGKAGVALEGVGAAGKGAEALQGVGALGKGAEAVEGGGLLSKSMGMFGKLKGGGKLLGKLALPLAIITSILDFFEGFINAEKFFGLDKKLSFMDRVAGGLGGVVEGLVGIVDFVLGLFGVKTDIGKIVGKGAAKTFQSMFKVLGSFFNVIMAIAKPLVKLLAPIIEIVGKHLVKMFENLSEALDGLSNILEGVVDWVEAIVAFFTGDWEKAGDKFMDGFKKIAGGLVDMISGVAKLLINLMGLGWLNTAFENFKGSFVGVFDSVSNMVKDWLGKDNFKMVTDVLNDIKDFFLSPFKWFKEHILGKTKNAPVVGPSAPKAPGLPEGYDPQTGKIKTKKGFVDTTVYRTGGYDQPQSEGGTDLRISKQTQDVMQAKLTPVSPPAPETPSISRESAPNMGSGLNVGGGDALRLNKSQRGNIDAITKELQSQGLNQKEIAAVLGNVGKETAFTLNTEGEMNGRKTVYSRDRAEKVFGKDRLAKAGVTDDDLRNPEALYNKIYGSGDRIGKSMNNLQEGDGYRFRGRGFLQLTGRRNYTAASKEIFGDDRLVKNPDLASDPVIASKITSWIIKGSGRQKAREMGIDLKNGSQEDINLAYTSGVAGTKITRGSGYLGGSDIIGKVDKYASAFTKPQPEGGAPMVTAPGATPPPPVMSSLAPQTIATPKLTQSSPGMMLTAASVQQSALARQNATLASTGSQIVNAPSSVTNNNTTVSNNLRAKNTDTSYERQQNSMFVPT